MGREVSEATKRKDVIDSALDMQRDIDAFLSTLDEDADAELSWGDTTSTDDLKETALALASDIQALEENR